MSLSVELSHEKIALILSQVAKREKVSLTEVTERFLRAGLASERARLISERDKKQPRRKGVPATNPCSDRFLQQICGKDADLCWWLSTCALMDW